MLSATLEQVAGVRQERPFGGRRFDEWIGRSPRLHWAIIGALLAAALLGAIAGVGALPRRETPPPLPPSRASNGWIAYSTSGHGRPPSSTDITTGSDIYLVRAGIAPRLIAGRQRGGIRNECPAFSPDGRQLAYSVDAGAERALVVLGVNADGVTTETARFAVPGPGSPVCPRWSSDGTRVAYLDGATVVVRGLDGSTPVVAGDPGAYGFGHGPDISSPLLSPSGDWIVRLTNDASGCHIVVARADSSAAHVIALGYCPYALPTWSPDGRQILLMEDVSGLDFTMHAIAVDSPFEATIVSTVRTNGARSWPGWGDVSWQPVFP